MTCTWVNRTLAQNKFTFSLYTRSRSLTTGSVSSDLVMSLEAQFGGGRSGAILIAGRPFFSSALMDATLKPFPHWLQILRPRHFSSKTSSRSLRLTTKSMSVTSSSISWIHNQIAKNEPQNMHTMRNIRYNLFKKDTILLFPA